MRQARAGGGKVVWGRARVGVRGFPGCGACAVAARAYHGVFGRISLATLSHVLLGRVRMRRASWEESHELP